MMASIEDLSKYITGEMRFNVDSPEARHIRLLQSSPPTLPLALALWAYLVWPENKWDHKPPINRKFGMWCFDPATKTEYYGDIWSNVHYGYIGLSVGFGEHTLKMGAGVAQALKSGLVDTFASECKKSGGAFACLPAFDDPKDQVSINIGFELWKTYGRNLTASTVCDKVRSNRARLSTRRKSS